MPDNQMTYNKKIRHELLHSSINTKYIQEHISHPYLKNDIIQKTLFLSYMK